MKKYKVPPRIVRDVLLATFLLLGEIDLHELVCCFLIILLFCGSYFMYSKCAPSNIFMQLHDYVILFDVIAYTCHTNKICTELYYNAGLSTT